ncbi:MAG: chromosome partitioning protein ParA [Pseudomonadales bacterium]|nr:chromosome partitioning protein ParA [Pseudomonadales bacterium]
MKSVTPLREIPLQRGLNLILSEPLEGSPGHGVGKTAFCQLLRFVLEDPQWAAGTPLRDELCQAMPNGAVAALVHVDGEAWTILKPWQHQKRYRAAKDTTWQQLATNEVSNKYDAYVRVLEERLVKTLPVQNLPGSNQAIQWQHLLAWCSRDQGSRYQSYYHWRIEGTGFSLPAQSPALLVKIVLGLLKDASLHNELKSKETCLSQLRTKIANLERRPADLLAHIRHQLATALGAEESSPFRAASLFDDVSLHGLAQQQIKKYTEELQQNHQRYKHLEQERLTVLEQQVPLRQQQRALQNRIAQLQAAINGNNTEVERLKKEPEALQEKLPRLCEPGNRLMQDCQYVRERLDVVQLSSIRDTRERQRKNEEYQSELRQQRRFLDELERKLSSFDTKFASLTSSLNDNKSLEVNILGRKKHLETAIAEYHDYEGIIANPSGWQELVALKDDEAALDTEIGQITLAIHHQQSEYAERKQALRDAADSIAKSIPGFTWGDFDCDKTPPFHMGPPHSTTYGVLETLTADLLCLLDSSHSESNHPGFLLHDSPREAEMSEVLLWSLLKIAKDNAATTCQYMVTTSTATPPAFEDYVRVRLHSREEEGFLFKKRIGTEARPLDM